MEVGLAGLAIRILLGWPTNACAALAALTVIVPLSMAAGSSRWFPMRADRLLVSTVSFIGLTALGLFGAGRAHADTDPDANRDTDGLASLFGGGLGRTPDVPLGCAGCWTAFGLWAGARRG